MSIARHSKSNWYLCCLASTAIGLLSLHSSPQAASKRNPDLAVTAVTDPITRTIGTGDTLGCEKVVLSAVDVVRYFSTATKVSAGTFHDESIILPCSFSGRLQYSGKLHEWNINAAGAGYLRSEDGALEMLYLCRTACAKALPQLVGR